MTAAALLLLLLAPPKQPPIDTCGLALWAAGAGQKPATLDVEVLAVQELATKPRVVRLDADSEIRTAVLPRDEFLLVLSNTSPRPVSVDVVWRELGFNIEAGSSPKVRDILARRNLGKVHGGFAHRLEPGQCALFRVKP